MFNEYINTHVMTLRVLIFTVTIMMAMGLKNLALSQTNAGSDGADKARRDNMIFTVVEKQPEFPGGISARKDFFVKHLETPKSDKKRKGTVYASFIVNTDGTLQDVEIQQSLQQAYDLEAIRVINLMPRWAPGIQSGKKVRVRYVLPVEFR